MRLDRIRSLSHHRAIERVLSVGLAYYAADTCLDSQTEFRFIQVPSYLILAIAQFPIELIGSMQWSYCFIP